MQHTYDTSSWVKIYTTVMSFLPFWWRFWQCINKHHHTGLRVHLINAGKYFSKMVPPFIVVFYPSSKKATDEMFWLFCTFNTIATLYCGAWDYYMDWGLLRS